MELEMAKIVVIDDDASVREVVVRILQFSQHEVLGFEDGAPALDEVDYHAVDLVITDMNMPTSGEKVIEHIRAQGSSVPIIVLSGYVDEIRAERLERMGVSRILNKPFKVPQLLGVVQEFVGKN
ncbi:MAG: response regulator [bacterium]|nr:response regulator [bacterium]